MLATVRPQCHLYVQSDLQSPESWSTPEGTVAAFSRRCPDSTQRNDDCAGIFQTDSGSTVLIVADGVGGCPKGFAASSIAVETVAEFVQQADSDDQLRSAILDGFERANDKILELGIGAATTLAVIEIRNRKARSYQVGDCMSLIIGQRGVLKWKSTPHSPIGYAVESGWLDEEDAMHHEERNLVSNLVGCRSMHIDIGPRLELAPRDTVLVGSDGLFDNLHLEEVIGISKSGPPLERMRNLVDLATLRMSQPLAETPSKADDLSILMFTS